MEYDVAPTAQVSPTNQYSDIALMGLFNSHISIINSERQAIWQRYNTMLLGNTIVFGFLAGAQQRTTLEVCFGTFFGLLLCAAWLVLTVSGWILFTMRVDVAGRFSWPTLDKEANPILTGFRYRSGTKGGWIYRMAVFVIVLFIVGYTFLVVDYLLLK